MPDQGSTGTASPPSASAESPVPDERERAEREARRLAHAASLQQDGETQSRLQSLYLRFNQLAWEGRRPLALKTCVEILATHGYQVAPAEEGSDDVVLTGWGEQRRIAFPDLKAFLRELVRPRAPAGADGLCRNCGARVMLADPECWHCAASFARHGFAPRPLRGPGLLARLRHLLGV